jgi:hypothetical protein
LSETKLASFHTSVNYATLIILLLKINMFNYTVKNT